MRAAIHAMALLMAATAVTAQSSPPMPKGTLSVGGRVIDSVTDAPVGGAMVTISPAEDPASPRIFNLPSRSTLASSDGAFLFRDLAAGKYAVAASAFGYASDAYPQRIVEVADGARPGGVSIRIAKFGSISGTVVDERGEPIAGVPVSALRRRVAGGGLMLQQEAGPVETDDRGMYRIAQLPPGSYAVGVLTTAASVPMELANPGTPGSREPARLALLRSGYRPATVEGFRAGATVMQLAGPAPPLAPDGRLLVFTNTFAPSTATAADATVVTLGAGEARTNIDIAVNLVPGVRVSGAAIGPNGPIDGVGIRLVPLTRGEAIEAYTADYNPAGAPMALTNAAGEFTFAAVPPGSYTLQSAVVELNPPAGSSGYSLFASQPLSVGDKSITGIAVALHRGLRISGRFQFKGGAPPALAANRPVIVGLRPLGAGLWRTIAARVTSGETFATEGDPPGKYLVYAQTGIAGWTLESIARGSRPLDDDFLELEDEDVRDLVVTFTNTPTRIRGTVTDTSGAPDADSVVVAFPADTTLWREGVISSRRVQRTRATSTASFEFTALTAGEYYIAAVSARFALRADDPAFLETLVGGATKMRVEPGGSTSVALKTIVPRGQ